MKDLAVHKNNSCWVDEQNDNGNRVTIKIIEEMKE